jgi:hypothetical protein
MTTIEQIEANRRKAYPARRLRSVAGKAVSSMNAPPSGIGAQLLIVRGAAAVTASPRPPRLLKMQPIPQGLALFRNFRPRPFSPLLAIRPAAPATCMETITCQQ